MGRIITFYSYKGGTGRSMALANIAWILASNGYRVLTVDWDLEAPGLQHYWSPFLVDKRLNHTKGIIDIVHEFSLEALTPPLAHQPGKSANKQQIGGSLIHPTSPSATVVEEDLNWYLPLADLSRHAVSIDYPAPTWGRLDFLPAGAHGPGYATRCNTFDWVAFYERLNGFVFLEALKASMRREYDYTLIDSRTGVSDTSGICTIELPDDVVLCFTPNNQSIEGAAAVAHSIRENRSASSSNAAVRFFPVPMRVETSEKEKLDRRMALARKCFDEFVELSPEDRDKYWKDVSVPYWPFYAFEEFLAVFADSPGGVNTLLSAYERIAGYLISKDIALVPPTAEHREIVKAAFSGRTEEPIDWEGLKIFISYSRDGADLALRPEKDLGREKDLVPWLDTRRSKLGKHWTKAIEAALDESKVVLALLTPGSYESEICRAEQLRALRKGKRLIPILAAQGADRPLHLMERQYRDFTDPGNYQARFQELLGDIRSGHTATLLEPYRSTQVTYLTAPPRVANYLDRPEALHALRDTLLEEERRQPIAITAVVGMGGIGKTVLAQALTRDAVVQQAFPDGIVWISTGRVVRSDVTEQMREIAKALGDDLSLYEDALVCENQYRRTIASKAALIVVDDVWSQADIEPLLAESARSRFLFTTRDASIGRFVSAREHSLNLLDQEQSRDLLAAWAAVPVAQLPAEADEVISECGRLPLALSVVGAMLHHVGPKSWSDTLDLLRKMDLSAIQEQLPEGQQSFFKAVEVSFQALSPQMQERYQALAVLPEDMAAPLPILETLWNASEADARRSSRHFVDRSLAQSNGADEGIRLHDLQLDYLRMQYPDQDALQLIRGAVRLSANVIERDPVQFTSQVFGRLLPHLDMPAIERFTTKVVEGTRTPWLRQLRPTLHPPGTSLIRTLEGHSGMVYDVALRGDGRCAVSASSDKTLKVWDVESGRELRTLEGHTQSVLGVALSGNGRRAVSGSYDKTLKVWDVESGRELRTLQGHTKSVLDVALSGSGRRAVSASDDKTLKVWDVESGRELHTLEGHTAAVNGVALSGSGRRAVSASVDNTLKVWDVESGRELRTLEGHSDSVTGVALSEDGTRAVSSSDDKTLKVWDVESGRELRTLQGHTAAVNGVAVSGDGRRAVSASEDKALKVWDVESGRELRTQQGHTAAVNGVAASGNGRRAVSASYDKTLKVWDVESGRELHTLEGHTKSVLGAALSEDGRRAVSASDDKTLKVWDVESGRGLRTLRGHSAAVTGVALSEDGTRAVSSSDDKTLKVWDVESGRELRTLQGHSDSVTGVALSEDGRRAVSASDDHTLKMWDVESGVQLATLTCDAAA
jgi:WD40 repeat protein